jgi:hypothetical protein
MCGPAWATIGPLTSTRSCRGEWSGYSTDDVF